MPFVVVPATGRGSRERRFALQPSRVLGVLFSVFVAGALLATGTFAAYWIFTDQALVREDYQRLANEVDALRVALSDLQSQQAESPRGAERAPTDDGEEGPPRLALAIPSINDKKNHIRIALLRSEGAVTLEGEGLLISQGRNQAIPMPRGRALTRVRPEGVWVEGVGILPDGTRIENRLGSIRIGDKEFPGILELHREGTRLLLVNEVELERYLHGVVAGELPAHWGLEIKKAQAVAARTYALMQRETSDKAYDVESTVSDQVYLASAIDPGSRAAVTATHGEVMTRDGYLVSAFYHSTCAGHTESPHNVWPERPSHGNSEVPCPHCSKAPGLKWQTQLKPEELLDAIRGQGHTAKRVTGLHIRERSSSGRVTRIDIMTDKEPVQWTGNEFREHLGWMRIKSARFDQNVDGDVFHLSGSGAGHGVGLCQWGARKMSRDGQDYRSILSTYYPLAKIEQIY
ncbi:MAG: hypothetical protein CL928_03200 [Deltaproteobacteria bacterium]|nr:hypothetical protein [Deltaproteobacteria bacterium]